MQTKPIPLDLIRTDGGTQSRTALSNETVTEYASYIEDGAEFPPIVLFHDGSDYWLADGFHRVYGHRHAGRVSILADIRSGTKRDALLYSIGANSSHGLRRTNQDKRRAIQMLLDDVDWCRWPENRIAMHCNVSRSLVRSVMDEAHLAEKQDAVVEVTRNGKTYTQNTSGLKAKAQKKPEPVEAPPEEGGMSHLVVELSAENETMRQKLAVMSGGDEANETLAELQQEVKTLRAELGVTRISRDDLARENAELKKQVTYWRKKADDAAKAVSA